MITSMHVKESKTVLSNIEFTTLSSINLLSQINNINDIDYENNKSYFINMAIIQRYKLNFLI